MMMNNDKKKSNNKKRQSSGMDTLLTIRGGPLKVGESLRFILVKGPSVQTSGDPVDSKAPPEQFPLVAKFGESVVRPEFSQEPWRSARLYQQEIPKPVDDSEEEDNNHGSATAAAASGDSSQQTQQYHSQPRKKRWRYGGDAPPPRQWILQENIDFLQTMIDRKEQKDNSLNDQKNQLSTRYEGIPEHNTSHYALFRVHSNSYSNNQYIDYDDPDSNNNSPTLQVSLLPNSPQNCFIQFSQPAARKTYTLTEAEHIISDQRMGLVKTLHHMLPNANNSTTASATGAATADTNKTAINGENNKTVEMQPRNILAMIKKAAQSNKGQLLNKLKSKSKTNEEEEEGDDVMGDVAFRSRKGGGAARKELLLSIGGGGLTVSDEGVLGGTNDAIFGGRQKFAQLSESYEPPPDAQDKKEGGGGGEEGDEGGATGATVAERGADGAAMDDDFYQRDVKAEYEELDYDAKEQFDDDDVDLGESEVVVDNAGFGGEDVEEEDDSDDVDQEEDIKGAEGLASVAGFKALLAKARGETPPDAEAASASSPTQNSGNSNRLDNSNNSNRAWPKKVDHMAKIMAAAEQSRLAAEQRAAKQPTDKSTSSSTTMMTSTATPALSQPQQQTSLPPQVPIPAAAAEKPLVDANGLRIITLEAVRREIWLNHGSIPMKRLMKIFDIKGKSSQDRQDKFRDILKELCTIKSDPISGRMLVLKQHYAKG